MTIAAWLVAAALFGGGVLWTPDLDRATLEARYAMPPSRFVNAAGLRWHVRDTGPTSQPSAPVLLLLHGFGSSLHTWDAWAEALQATHRVIRVDLPGAGLTGPDPGNRYSDAHAVSQLAALLGQLGVARASLVGHSMGGRLAWRFAAEQPQQVDKLVLVAPDGFASPGFEYGKPPQVGFAMKLMPYALPKVLVRWGLEPAFANPAAVTDALVTRHHDLVLAPGVRGALMARLEQMQLQDPTPFLARITAPTLLLWGEQDAMIPLANAQDYLRAMPQAHARLVVLPGVGHLPQEENPSEGLEALREFLTQGR